MVVDCSKLTNLDFSGAEAFVHGAERLAKANVVLKLCGLQVSPVFENSIVVCLFCPGEVLPRFGEATFGNASRQIIKINLFHFFLFYASYCVNFHTNFHLCSIFNLLRIFAALLMLSAVKKLCCGYFSDLRPKNSTRVFWNSLAKQWSIQKTVFNWVKLLNTQLWFFSFNHFQQGQELHQQVNKNQLRNDRKQRSIQFFCLFRSGITKRCLNEWISKKPASKSTSLSKKPRLKSQPRK